MQNLVNTLKPLTRKSPTPVVINALSLVDSYCTDEKLLYHIQSFRVAVINSIGSELFETRVNELIIGIISIIEIEVDPIVAAIKVYQSDIQMINNKKITVSQGIIEITKLSHTFIEKYPLTSPYIKNFINNISQLKHSFIDGIKFAEYMHGMSRYVDIIVARYTKYKYDKKAGTITYAMSKIMHSNINRIMAQKIVSAMIYANIEKYNNHIVIIEAIVNLSLHCQTDYTKYNMELMKVLLQNEK